jgi:hypothetical protein
MKKILYPIQTIALYLMLLIAAGYAGIHFSSLMNPSIFGFINPQGDLMAPENWAASWQLTDGFMRARMGVYGPIIMYGYVITLILLFANGGVLFFGSYYWLLVCLWLMYF